MHPERVNQSGILGQLSWQNRDHSKKSLLAKGFSAVTPRPGSVVPCSQE